uniref:Uncharacterized protein n=1 Tax=viral metagenome TaxID=1070528 RepID=A0A6M3L7Y5_9ZZZZ
MPFILQAALDMAEPTFSGLKFRAAFVAGGYYDQPMRDTIEAKTALNVYQAMQSYKNARDTPKWESDNPGYAKIYRLVLKLRGV